MATKKDSSTDVAEVKNTAVATGGFNYGEDAGGGFETTKGSDLSIPFINLLQSNSPDVQKCQDGTIILGMMKNSVTGEYTKRTGFNFLPVHKEEAFVEWIPRLKGGGFVKLHDPASPEVEKALADNGGRIPKKGADGKKIPIKIGENELVETYYVYGLLLDETGEQVNGFAVIPFTSTKIKPYRDWITAMYMIRGRPPMFAIRARISAEVQTNEAGTFANYKISPFKDGNWVSSLIDPASNLFAEGKSFREMVINGMARADFNSQRNEESDHGGGGDRSPSAGSAGNADETPF